MKKKRIDVPYFLLGFVMMALFHTYVSLPHMVMQIIDNITICLIDGNGCIRVKCFI